MSQAETPRTPLVWRILLLGGVVGLALLTFWNRHWLGSQGQAGAGLLCFFGLTAALSSNLRAVNWRTIGAGIALQVMLALFILHSEIGRELFNFLGAVITKFLDFTNEGSKFVFGALAEPQTVEGAFGEKKGFVFAFQALPTIIFVSSVFAVLYYFGVLQFLVRIMAVAMRFVMGTSGAETLSSTANVFMGQTEAPLLVRPYVKTMTQSELLALMAGGMATVSGGVMAIYISFGADAMAMLATSVMAAPCALYLSKLMLPETEESMTYGKVRMRLEQQHRNAIDAAAGGALDGLTLALNVAAVLLAFIAIVAMIDYVLFVFDRGLGIDGGWSLKMFFSHLFRPVAMLIGVEEADNLNVANLLGMKLAVNELAAYDIMRDITFEHPRSRILATFALTGFANFASVGICIGGIGAMAPERRPDLARLGARALYVGFTATLVNAALVGLIT